jgi:DNA-binding transcriptional LysR family regulator
MTFLQLRYFVAIVDAGLNITLAAPRVHATQSTLSKQLKLMEDELGFLLFTRRGRTLTALTPAGLNVLEHARSALLAMANIRSLAADTRSDARGELHIATTHTQARYALAGALRRTSERYPQVTVHLAPGGDRESLDRLRRNEAEMAIVSSAGDTPDAEIALPLYRWDRVVLVPRDHPLSKLQRPLQLADLAAHRLVSYESSREARSSLRRTFTDAGLVPEIAVTARDGDLIKTYVRAGMGVGIVAEMAVDTDDADLQAIAVTHILPTCVSWLLMRRDHLLREHAQFFILQLLRGISANELRRHMSGEQLIPAGPATPSWQQWNPPLNRPDLSEARSGRAQVVLGAAEQAQRSGATRA